MYCRINILCAVKERLVFCNRKKEDKDGASRISKTRKCLPSVCVKECANFEAKSNAAESATRPTAARRAPRVFSAELCEASISFMVIKISCSMKYEGGRDSGSLAESFCALFTMRDIVWRGRWKTAWMSTSSTRHSLHAQIRRRHHNH